MIQAQERTMAQKASMVFGAIFLFAGIAGFIPGITTAFDRIDVYDEPGAKLLGIFAVNWLHNIVHLLSGVAGLAMARTHDQARSYLIGGGVIYLVLWIYGMAIDQTSPANFVALNTAANWLHLGLGLGLLGSGIAFGKVAVAETSSRQDLRRAS